ncbi:hypothetical protein ACL9RI_12065 [Janthinobacterium sp. Mn2066]|uniref:hypothetical protein n=1 Tax=Janthinobacterium sp. Mn2066 TaxID=3395264 RepID=UPI003BEB579E
MSNSKFMQDPYLLAEDAAMPYLPDSDGMAAPSVVHGRLEAAKRRNERALMAIEGVEGVSLGHNLRGNETIVLYVRDASVRQRVPAQVEGYAVETSITGQIDILQR